MKNRTLILLVLIMAVLIIAGSCATGKKTYISAEDVLKKLEGAWYNKEYSDHPNLLGKIIIQPNGIWEEYRKDTSTKRTYFFKITMIEMWTDSKDNTLFKATGTEGVYAHDYVAYIFGKISSDALT